jgi:hypothetical protein
MPCGEQERRGSVYVGGGEGVVSQPSVGAGDHRAIVWRRCMTGADHPYRLRTGLLVVPIRSRAAQLVSFETADLPSAGGDAPHQPCIYLLLHPSDGASTDLDALGKAKISLHLIDHRTAQARDLTDLRQSQNPNRVCIRGDHGDHGETPARGWLR